MSAKPVLDAGCDVFTRDFETGSNDYLLLTVNVDSVLDIDPTALVQDPSLDTVLRAKNGSPHVFSHWCERMFAVGIRYPDETAIESVRSPFVRCLINVPDIKHPASDGFEPLVVAPRSPNSVSCVLRMQLQCDYRGQDSRFIIVQLSELTDSGPRVFSEACVPVWDLVQHHMRTHPEARLRHSDSLELERVRLQVNQHPLPQPGALQFFPLYRLNTQELRPFERLRTRLKDKGVALETARPAWEDAREDDDRDPRGEAPVGRISLSVGVVDLRERFGVEAS